jgi:hypothetical protein
LPHVISATGYGNVIGTALFVSPLGGVSASPILELLARTIPGRAGKVGILEHNAGNVVRRGNSHNQSVLDKEDL